MRQRKKIQEVLRRLSRRRAAFPSAGRAVTSLAAALLAGACTTFEVPAPEPSEHFSTAGTGFRIDTRERAVYYTLTLKAREPLPAALYLEAVFENPDDPEEPLVERMEVAAGERFVHLESPPVPGLRMGEVYAIEVLIFDDPESSEPVDRHVEYTYSHVETRRHEENWKE